MKRGSHLTTQVESRVAAPEERVARLEQHSEENVIVLREITLEEARAEIVDLFATTDRACRRSTTPTSPAACDLTWKRSGRYATTSKSKRRSTLPTG